jgi:hypothetical protein
LPAIGEETLYRHKNTAIDDGEFTFTTLPDSQGPSPALPHTRGEKPQEAAPLPSGATLGYRLAKPGESAAEQIARAKHAIEAQSAGSHTGVHAGKRKEVLPRPVIAKRHASFGVLNDEFTTFVIETQGMQALARLTGKTP